MDGEKLITICAQLGLAVAAVAAFLAIGKHKNLSDVIRIAGAGVFVTVLILVYPYYAAGEGPYALWISLFHAMCAMLMNAGPSEIIDALSAYAVPFIGVYNAAVLALHIIAPLFTLGILSLGSEKRNLDTAITVRRFYGLRDGFPKIHILTDHKTTDEQLLPLLSVSDWKLAPEKDHYDSRFLCSFDLKPFGSYETVYGSMDHRSYRDWLAVAVNASRIGVFALSEHDTPERLCELYNQVDMYKNYSDAFADDVEQKLFIMGLTLKDDGKGDLSSLSERFPQYENRLMAQESRRFEIFMRGYGWSELPLDEVQGGVYQDKLRRSHARICASATKELSEKLGRDFENEDRISCRRLPDILALANALSGVKMSAVPLKKQPVKEAENHV